MKRLSVKWISLTALLASISCGTSEDDAVKSETLVIRASKQALTELGISQWMISIGQGYLRKKIIGLNNHDEEVVTIFQSQLNELEFNAHALSFWNNRPELLSINGEGEIVAQTANGLEMFLKVSAMIDHDVITAQGKAENVLAGSVEKLKEGAEIVRKEIEKGMKKIEELQAKIKNSAFCQDAVRKNQSKVEMVMQGGGITAIPSCGGCVLFSGISANFPNPLTVACAGSTCYICAMSIGISVTTVGTLASCGAFDK